jgi:hypothetical protein
MSRLRRWVIRVLCAVLRWLDPPAPPSPATALARTLVQAADALPGLAPGSGEYKRHVVLGRLVKECPQIAKRELSALIEEALR